MWKLVFLSHSKKNSKLKNVLKKLSTRGFIWFVFTVVLTNIRRKFAHLSLQRQIKVKGKVKANTENQETPIVGVTALKEKDIVPLVVLDPYGPWMLVSRKPRRDRKKVYSGPAGIVKKKGEQGGEQVSGGTFSTLQSLGDDQENDGGVDTV